MLLLWPLKAHACSKLSTQQTFAQLLHTEYKQSGLNSFGISTGPSRPDGTISREDCEQSHVSAVCLSSPALAKADLRLKVNHRNLNLVSVLMSCIVC